MDKEGATMDIKTSNGEGQVHIGLKRKIIEVLQQRDDIAFIDTEVTINKRKGHRVSIVDVLAQKEDGNNIYVEVKSDADISGAIYQLMGIDKKVEGEEFILVIPYKTPLFFKRLLLPDVKIINEINKEAMDMINKTTIYTFDNELNLTTKDIKYIDGKELWIDGIKIMDMSRR